MKKKENNYNFSEATPVKNERVQNKYMDFSTKSVRKIQSRQGGRKSRPPIHVNLVTFQD